MICQRNVRKKDIFNFRELDRVAILRKSRVKLDCKKPLHAVTLKKKRPLLRFVSSYTIPINI